MNQSLLFFLEVTVGLTRLFQNCFVIFLIITGFCLCNKYASTQTPSKKMIGLESETKRTNFTRLILYLICFFGIVGIDACSIMAASP
jgi:accessory gene regulator protein AgrB